MIRFMLIASSLILGVNSFAFEPSVPNPQQVDGQDTTDSCGTGWSVTQSVTLMGTSTRGTTNAFLPPSFSMTSGTSGCEQHGFAKNEQPAVMFVLTNHDALEIEMAQGKGEYVAGMAQAMGCNGFAFSSMVQAHYGEIFTRERTTPVQMYKNLKHQIRQDQHLRNTCSIS